MRVAAFTLTTNAIKFQYPFIESIKSWLPAVNELVVIDGGSTDGTIEAIEAIGDPKIRIISDEKTKWGEEWEYSQMGKNFQRGYEECTGDFVFKFDTDYILHEKAYENGGDPEFNLWNACRQSTEQNAMVIGFIRRNLALVDRYFFKKQKTLGVNRNIIKKHNTSIVYGLDMKRWGWGYEPITLESEQHNLKFGRLVNALGNTFQSNIEVWNYGFCFCDKLTVNWIRQRHIWAEVKQQLKGYDHFNCSPLIQPENLRKHPNYGLDKQIKDMTGYLKNRVQTKVKLEEHPKIIQEKIKNLTPDKQGYNMWGLYDTAEYFK